MAVDPAALLAGLRGRRLCLEFARARHVDTQEAGQLGAAIFYAASDLDPGRGASRVVFSLGVDRAPPTYSPDDIARMLAAVPLAEPDERNLLHALGAAVDAARYWQEPDGEDVLAAAPELRLPLARVGNLIADSPHAAWWSTPLERAAQWMVHFAGTPGADATTTSGAETLERWRAAQVCEEIVAERERPADPRAAWSGTWWSKPPSTLTRTTRTLSGGGPVGLWLVEDSLGWKKATAHQVRVPPDARVYEIDSPEAWADLCRRYPLEVSASRRHDWYRITARGGRWVIPDWAHVGKDFDAVHLTVAGYLATAGHALPVEDDVMTVLAGWDPDQTYWLTEVEQDNQTDRTWLYSYEQGWTPAAAG
jgi:hypothetical protein